MTRHELRAALAAAVIALPATAGPGASAQTTITPGSTQLHPQRVRLARDSILVVQVDTTGARSVVATLVRRIDRVSGGREPLYRETQRYWYGNGQYEFDTLDVVARTLALHRIAEIGPHTHNVLEARGDRLVGSVTPTDTSTRRVDVPLPAAFHDMMLEAFIGAFPISSGSAFIIPTLRPPSTDVRAITLVVDTGTVVLRTARGLVRCRVVTRRGGDVTTWVAASDGHIVRLRWSAPGGLTFWKLPAADEPFLPDRR